MQNLKIIDKGGRPPKDFIREHIIEILSKLKRAYPKQVYQHYSKEMKDDDKQVSYRTVLRHMQKMVKDNGPLKRVSASFTEKNPVYLYEIKMENS